MKRKIRKRIKSKSQSKSRIVKSFS